MSRVNADTHTEWYRLSVDDTLARLHTDREGLRRDQARERAERYGPNRIRRDEGVSAWRVLLGQFASPLVYVLTGALVVTVAIGNWADAIVIGLVLVINTTVGFLQEYQAETAVQSLMEMVSPRARVSREGREVEIDAEDLVPGDVVRLAQGEVVPADVRLTDVRGLQVDEAPLTGESVPVAKTANALADAEEHLPPADQRNLAFMGTAVTSGDGRGVVVATGARTEIGQIAEQVQEAEDTQTPLQRRIDLLARWITVAVLGVALVAVGVGLLLGRSLVEMVLLAVALAVAAIPAGLPIVVTVALAIGVRRMARRHAVIRHLPAVDTLGSCTTILSDKTGTLTQNRMTVRAIIAGGQRFGVSGVADEPDRAFTRDGDPVDPSERAALSATLRVGVLCNEAQLARDGSTDDADGDPMEVALLVAGFAVGLTREHLQQRYPLRETVPFRTEQRYMATIHDVVAGDRAVDDGDPTGMIGGARPGGPLVLVKGAPERVVEMCERQRISEGGEESLDADRVVDQSEALAAEGLRVLAMAVGRGDTAARAAREGHPQGLTFVGMQGLLDPPRRSAIEAVDRCHDAGIRVAMVTGDHATDRGGDRPPGPSRPSAGPPRDAP